VGSRGWGLKRSGARRGSVGRAARGRGCMGGGMEEAATKRAAKGAGRAMRQPNPIPYQGHGVSHAPLEEWSGGKSHCSPVPSALPVCRTGAPLRIELRLLEIQNHRGELRVHVLFVLTCRLFRRASPHEGYRAPQGAAICPAQRKNFCIRGCAG
jgi:hypothetical protein